MHAIFIVWRFEGCVCGSDALVTVKVHFDDIAMSVFFKNAP